MILRILIVLAVIYLVWRLVRLVKSHLAAGNQSSEPGRGGLRVSSVRCAHCGLFLPEPDALRYDGRYFCSAEHRDAMKDDGVSS